MKQVLNEELITTLCEYIEEGVPTAYACDIIHLSENTYRNWYEQGQSDSEENKDTIYSKLYESVRESYAQFIRTSKKTITRGLPGWQGTAWWLERTNNKFMPKQEVTAGEDGKVTVVLGGKIREIKKAPDDIKYINNK